MGTKKSTSYDIVIETGSGVYNGSARSENLSCGFFSLKLEIHI